MCVRATKREAIIASLDGHKGVKREAEKLRKKTRKNSSKKTRNIKNSSKNIFQMIEYQQIGRKKTLKDRISEIDRKKLLTIEKRLNNAKKKNRIETVDPISKVLCRNANLCQKLSLKIMVQTHG